MKKTATRVRSQKKGARDRARWGPRAPIGNKGLPSTACEIIRRLVSEGQVNIGRAAFLAGVSKRTLQRRLAQAGLEYSVLVDDFRMAKALVLIDNPAIRLADITRALGYSDAANFVRAFRRWTGFSPSQFRELDGEKRAAIIAVRLRSNLLHSPPLAHNDKC